MERHGSHCTDFYEIWYSVCFFDCLCVHAGTNLYSFILPLLNYGHQNCAARWKWHRRLGNKIVTSKRRYTNQRLDHRLDGEASISCRWHQVSWQSQVIWSPFLRQRPITGRLIDACFRSYKLCVRGQVFGRKSIVGHPSFCVEFHFFCGIAVPRTQTTAFSCYGYFICMPGVFHGTKKDATQIGLVRVLL